MNKVGVLGFGSWGRALSKVLYDAQNDVMVYSRQSCEKLKEENIALSFSNDLSEVIRFADFVVITTKASDVLALVEQMKEKDLVIKNCIITSKGFNDDGRLLSDVLSDVVIGEVGVLAGPNFASEIIDCKLTLSTLSSNIPDIFSNAQFKIERCADIIGLQVSSVIKNIYAIGCGIIVTAFDSENTKAAFLSIAFHELLCAIELFGGVHETAYTAAGLGDLVLTCYSKNSRNHMFGEMFARGIYDNTVTVEGYSSIMRLRSDIRDKLQLCDVIYRFLNHQINLDEFKDVFSHILGSRLS
jgi:glycerol-3-phosphate dehydrogenase (NAD(P)+)